MTARATYDVVIAGARPAGAGTALLLSRHGLRVLVVDRSQYGADTLSTHALMRAGVLQLARWGVLPAVQAAGTPPVRRATFVYSGDAISVHVKPRDGVDALYAPRRTVLDRAIVDAAIASGVEVSYGTQVTGVTRDDRGRVTGVIAHGQTGWSRSIEAALVIGADGLRSTLARLVGAGVSHTGVASSANVYGYWSGLPVDGYRWYYHPGLSVGAIPTNDGQTCVFASAATSRFPTLFRDDVAGGYHRVIRETAPDLAEAMARASLAGTLHGFPGQAGLLRRCTGPGWALVGDAAYFKDPITAHGITDALVEADYLARAVVTGTAAALAEYEADRDRRVRPLHDITDRIASFEWSLDEVRSLHRQLADAMAAEVKALPQTALEGATA
jgi:menaquinone-9 beta-reductase